MKYHRLHIDIEESLDTYNKITDLLGVKPTKLKGYRDSHNKYDLWTYIIDVDDNEQYYDFINSFLDILDPKFDELKKLGIDKSNITFWLLYEYDQQCGLEFHPQEMKRLGESGIVLCIDCWQLDNKGIDIK
jgi:hypothetical protein